MMTNFRRLLSLLHGQVTFNFSLQLQHVLQRLIFIVLQICRLDGTVIVIALLRISFDLLHHLKALLHGQINFGRFLCALRLDFVLIVLTMTHFGKELNFFKCSLEFNLGQSVLFLLIDAWLALDYGLVEAICLLQVEIDVFNCVLALVYWCLAIGVIPCRIGIEMGDCGSVLIGEWPMHCC